MCAVDGVAGVQDLHIRAVTSGLVSLSAHVGIARMAAWESGLLALPEVLCDRFGIGM